MLETHSEHIHDAFLQGIVVVFCDAELHQLLSILLEMLGLSVKVTQVLNRSTDTLSDVKCVLEKLLIFEHVLFAFVWQKMEDALVFLEHLLHDNGTDLLETISVLKVVPVVRNQLDFID